jgi:hypothetical protein
MRYLDAYHLSNTETQAQRDERIAADKTCLSCGYVDETANGHPCPAVTAGASA